MDSSTMIRLPHKQISPWLLKEDCSVSVIILSQYESANMIAGFFPPNSSDNFLNCGAARLAILAPDFVLPVKEMVLIPGCLTSASPGPAPVPCKIFRTPAGRPAVFTIRLKRKAVTGVISEGFATTQFP